MRPTITTARVGTHRARQGMLAVVLAVLAACDGDVKDQAATLTGGQPDRGARAISVYGCGSCHTIPRVPGANALVGPPLAGIASRVYIAGVLPNTPENMLRWIQHPQQVDPRTAMHDVGVSDADASDIASYLYTLR